MKTVKTIIVLMFTVLWLTQAYALEKPTHEAINEVAANISSANDYLINQLKITGGLETYFSNGSLNKKAIKWIQLGGKTEDEPFYSRSFNHYLNPINNSGYGGLFKSALEWSHAQDTIGSTFGGDYDWSAVRSYYLNALISTDKATRDSYFASTFQGVGQLMHLVTDMSVPAHTRNDGHILYNYENHVLANSGEVSTAGANPIFYSGTLTTYDPLFLDLAAFSNANFLSDDTIFTGFTYPRIDDTELWTDMTNNRSYLRKPVVTAAGVSTGVAVEHLVATSWLYFYRLRYFPQDKKYIPVGLDDTVYADYAALLLPRAVGYSANLLSFFFRGNISMVEDTENPGTYKITNNSEEPINGAFNLYYDDTNDNRDLVPGVDFGAVNGVTLASKESASIPSFSEPSDIKEPGKYMLVFNGTLGHEYSAVVGASVSLKPGIWEDFDGPNGSKQNWMPPGYSGNIYTYEVVKGYGSNNTNVLKISGIATRSWDYLYARIPASTPMPKSMSFDYFARSVNLSRWGFDYLGLWAGGRLTGGQPYGAELNAVNTANLYKLGCYKRSWGESEYCNEQMAAGSWKHVGDMPLRQGALNEVYLIISGRIEGAPHEIYIDNIDLKWE